jgi:hypothetical protein
VETLPAGRQGVERWKYGNMEEWKSGKLYLYDFVLM